MLARTLTCMTCTIGLAVSLSAISGTPAAAQFTFEQYEVVTDSAARQSIVTGFLLDGAFADLAVVHLDENDDRRLRIYAFGAETWVPRLDATLGPDVTFVDVANIGGRDRLLAYEPGRLNWFDPESSTERTLVAVTASFSPPRSDQIHHVDITRDVNHDGRDDLVVPDVDGFWVVIQMSDGAFADPAKIGPAADMSGIYGADGYRYDPWGQSRIHEMDYNHDGRSDLVFWREDHFEVHTQDERGLFAPVAETFTTEVAFDSDDRSSLAAGDMAGRVLHSLTDLNGDGVGDLIVFRLEGRRVSSKQSAYEVHFGTPASDGGTAWTPDLDAAIRSDGSIQLGMDRLDFDRDGQVDMMVTTIGARFVGSTLYRRFRERGWRDLPTLSQERTMGSVWRVLLAVSVCAAVGLGAAGCSSNPPPEPPPPPAAPAPTLTEEERFERMSLAELNDQMPLDPVFFDYDMAEIHPDARSVLQRNADWMQGEVVFGGAALVGVAGDLNPCGGPATSPWARSVPRRFETIWSVSESTTVESPPSAMVRSDRSARNRPRAVGRRTAAGHFRITAK